jgi:hypothetical protein
MYFPKCNFRGRFYLRAVLVTQCHQEPNDEEHTKRSALSVELARALLCLPLTNPKAH